MWEKFSECDHDISSGATQSRPHCSNQFKLLLWKDPQIPFLNNCLRPVAAVYPDTSSYFLCSNCTAKWLLGITLLLVPRTPRAAASSGQLQRGQNFWWFSFSNYLECWSGTGQTLAGLRCQVSSEVWVSLRTLHGQWSNVTVRLAGGECPPPSNIRTHAFFGLLLVGRCIYLLLLLVSLSSGMQRASLPLHGHRRL